MFILEDYKTSLTTMANANAENEPYTNESFEKTFAIPKKLLGLLGIRMTHDLSEIKAKWWSFVYCFELLNFIPAPLAELIFVVMTIKKADSFINAMEVFRMIPCIGMCVTGLLKSLKIKRNRSTFEALYHELHEMWPKEADELIQEEKDITEAFSKQLNFVIKGYYWCNNIFIVSYVLPLMVRYILWSLGYDISIDLFFQYWIPFDPRQPALFDFMLLHQTIGGLTIPMYLVLTLTVAWWNVTWDMLFYVFTAHITMQFELLSPRIRHLTHVPVDQQLVASYPLAKTIPYDKIENVVTASHRDHNLEREERELRNIINKHHKLNRLTGIMEKMFSFELLANFLNSSMIICMCGFYCFLIEKWDEFTFKTFLVTALFQTWLLCWYGQKVLDSNQTLCQALYECGWYNQSKKVKSTILIMLIRAQKGVQITTCGFSVLSLSSYATIIKTSWSYFTLLLNFYSGED